MDPPGIPTTADDVEQRRAAVLADIPQGYSGLVHGGVVLGMGLALLVGPLFMLVNVQPREWAMVPAAFIIANLVEYLVHKGPLHHPSTPRILYRRHTLIHHVAFTDAHMEMRHPREMRFVLFPFFALPALEVLVSPITVGLWLLGQHNLSLLFVSTGAAYYLLYELLHLAYHLPAEHPVSRMEIIRRLGAHHRVHHDLRRMTAGNFNVSIPLWDWLLGTRLRAEAGGTHP